MYGRKRKTMRSYKLSIKCCFLSVTINIWKIYLVLQKRKKIRSQKKVKNEVILNNHDWPKKYLKQKPSMAKIQTGIKK